MPRAEMELLLAVGGDPDWKLLRRRLVELHAAWGVRLFRGVESGAIPHWEQALQLEDRAKHLRYYLAHAYYRLDDRDQSRALTRGLELVALTRDRGILADAYQRLGDMHFKAHHDDAARRMYRMSLAMIPDSPRFGPIVPQSRFRRCGCGRTFAGESQGGKLQ